MKFVPTVIPEVIIIEPEVFGDDRGFFMETYRADVVDGLTGGKPFVQDNHSKSSKGILRGLHYQVEKTQGKLIRVIAGEVFDVAVDMRRHSATFGKWVGTTISAENKRQLWVPEGFAHGFYVTSDSAEFVYKCTDYYAPEYDRSLVWNDPAIGIEWPLIKNQPPILSVKDEAGRLFCEADTFDY